MISCVSASFTLEFINLVIAGMPISSLGNPLPRRAGEMYSLLAVVPWTASEQGELGVGCRSQVIYIEMQLQDLKIEVQDGMEINAKIKLKKR